MYNNYYLARARMSPSPDPAEAIVSSWDLGLSGLVWRISKWTDFNESLYDVYWYGLVVHALV